MLRKFLAAALVLAGAPVALADGINNPSPSARINTIRSASSSADNISATDYFVCPANSVGSATETLPPSPVAGQPFVVKDCNGASHSNNITIIPSSGTIDGASSYVMNVNYESVTIMYSGTQWLVY